MLIGLLGTLWLVFGISSAGKLRGRQAFADSLRPLGFVPDRRVAVVAGLVPVDAPASDR